MKKPFNWMKAHPIASFFVLALAMMFILGFPVVYLIGLADQPLLQILILYVARLSVYAAVLAGMLVTRWTLPDQSSTSDRNRRLTFGTVWLVAIVVYALDLR